jgi:ketosteroid isomerase-like protein
MSQENVEIVEEWTEAWNRRDLERMLGLFHPEIEWRTSGAFPGVAPVYAGHDGFRQFWSEFIEPWESFVISTDEVRDCGEHVLGLGTFEGVGRDGLRVKRPTASVWTFRDRLAIRNQVYADWDQAFVALGLRPRELGQ